MPIKRRRSPFIISLALSIFLLYGNIFLTPPRLAFGFTFAVMSDPHAASDSWVNTLTEVRDMKINPHPKFTPSVFILVTGDINPINLRYEDYNKVFKDPGSKPIFLSVMGNHDVYDTGGMTGTAMGQGSTPQGQGGGRHAMGISQGGGGPPPEGGAPSQGGTRGQKGQKPGEAPQVPGNLPRWYMENGARSIIHTEFMSDKIIAAIPGAVRMSDKSCSYYYDYENVRVISLDAYSSETGSQGIINEKGREWAEEVIKSAPTTIEHIFIAFHAPAFPRARHTHDSFDADPGQRNTFWNMLISHRDRVRAVFCGHTHYYCRMRVLDPAGSAANDYSAYPDEEGGIYQVNVGSTGNSEKNTFLRVEIDGKNIYFRAYEAENGKDQPFTVKDEWSIKGK